jgi:tRNA G18 (ribose-2'-O)-methylase SpoU
LPVFTITDPSDPRLADYRNIPDPELIHERGLFVAEGRLVVRRLLLESRFTARSMLLTTAGHESLADALVGREDLPVYLVEPPVVQAITGFDIHRGCLAIGERAEAAAWEDVIGGARTLVLLERVTNADNVGGIFRAAAAFGADAVLLDRGTLDPLYRKAIRTSMGAALVTPFARVDSCSGAIHALRRRGVATIALTPRSDAPSLRDVRDAVPHRPVAIAVGHEGDGLTAATIDACEFRARIPISSAVDSLNVATAAAVALYELTLYRDIGHRDIGASGLD